MKMNINLRIGSPIGIKTPPDTKFRQNSYKNREKSSDRLLPRRISPDLYSFYLNDMEIETSPNQKLSTHQRKNKETFSNLLKHNLSNEYNKSHQIFYYSNKINESSYFFEHNKANLSPTRKISNIPYRILDAPNLSDDFYLNILDWSVSNCIGIGLQTELFILSTINNKITRIHCLEEETDYIGAVSWSPDGNQLAIGTNYGQIKLFDTNKEKLICQIQAHSERIGSIDWNNNLIASGSRDKTIKIFDIKSFNTKLYDLSFHKQEICGLKWSFDQSMLASGGNDNKVILWSLKKQAELIKFNEHTAAVKAIAWSPHQHNILVSGGGSSDRTIRIWNTFNLKEIDCFDSGSQVCNLMFSKNNMELVSTHGFSLNQINVWKFPSFENVATLLGHEFRVLQLSGSPCGENIVTGAGDETLRFWNLFPKSKKENKLNEIQRKYDIR